jgi:hypothetical protein
MAAALDRADGDGIGNHPRFRARLDYEQSPDLAQHRLSLTRQRANGSFGPSPV